MAIITYLSIITLNVSGLNAPIKRDRSLNGLKKKRLVHRLPTKDPLHVERYTLTEDKGMEKDIS